ncbi:protein xhlA, partial [Bacillus licheniformis]|nr:protein xhlA [Bacillus licheniformis]
MHQTNELDVFKHEITELKADHKTLEQRVITLERASDRHDQQIMSIN